MSNSTFPFAVLLPGLKTLVVVYGSVLPESAFTTCLRADALPGRKAVLPGAGHSPPPGPDRAGRAGGR